MTKPTPRTAQARQANVAALRARQQWAERRRKMVTVGAIAAGLLIVTGGVAWGVSRGASGDTNAPSSSTEPSSSTASSSSAASSIQGLVTYPNLARGHVTGSVTYAQTPPAGGDHSAVWQNAGIYNAPVPNENAVHTLEHGGFWITYQPGLSADQIAAIKSAVAGKAYALVSPYPGQPSPVAATAWGVQLKLDTATDPRLAQFIAAYADGSKAPEPGGEVTGGTGTPTG